MKRVFAIRDTRADGYFCVFQATANEILFGKYSNFR
jgi:hypothetical protein